MIDEWEEHSLINERADEVISSMNSREEVRLVIDYCFNTGGKRTRPLILLLSTGVAGGDMEEALDAAVAVEFVHNASLLHDDILDMGLFRRGQDTPYQKFGYKPALLSGDLLITLAIDLMVDNYGASFVKRINDVVKEIINGEVMDVTSDMDTSLEEYESCIESKTAVLFGAAAALGGEVANSPYVDELETFSTKSGKAYQIVDDLMEFLQVQRDKEALESSLTLPEVYMRDKDVDKKEAVRLSLKRVNELVEEAISELDVFEDSEEKEKLVDLVRYMTRGTIERGSCEVMGVPLENLMVEA